MSIDFIVEKIILNKDGCFTEEEIINDKRLREYPYRKSIIRSVLSKFFADEVINMVGGYNQYKVNKKNRER